MAQQPAAQAGAAAAAAPAVPTFTFATTPAEANDQPLDMSSAIGQKFFKTATEPLATPFDGTTQGLRLFLYFVAQRAELQNWSNIITIPDANGVDRDLLKDHRLLTLADVRAHAATYLLNQDRRAQDSRMMYVFLLKSISQEAQNRMVPDDASFRVTTENIPSGPAYLKVLLTEFAAATNATSYHIRENLHNLPKKMKSLNDDIERFNTYVKVQLADLAAGGQSTMDLIVFLFTSYLSVKDSEFVEYIKLKKSAYDESPPGANTITPEALMSMALSKYHQLKQANVWRQKSKTEETIIALTAKLKQAEALLLHGKQPPSKKPTPNADGDKDKGKGKREFKVAAWKRERPAGGKGTLQKNGKTYHWCEHHGYYTLSHETKDCQLTGDQKQEHKKRREEYEKQKKSRQLKLANPAITDAEDNPFHDS